ncbi:MAG: DUF983 domain-containing protein [Gemmatimonadales bacterium]
MPVTPLSLPRRRTMLLRGLVRRCPACGEGGMFHHWFKIKASCPACGLASNRGEDGYSLGALWFNLLMAEAVSVGLFLTTLALTWPTPPWGVLQYTAPIEAAIMPLLFFPFARTLFLAFDLCFRPYEVGDRRD